jgi:hypothetical protein
LNEAAYDLGEFFTISRKVWSFLAS